MSRTALGGVKVVELCSMVAGPFCTKLLADLGAEVIKVEAPGSGDAARRLGPFLDDLPDPEGSGLFLHLNTSKLGITLDVQKAAGRDILRRLLKSAEVFVVDVGSAGLKPLGLDYESLRSLNPGLVMTSVTPFGNTGPYSEYKAYDLNIFHSSGGAFPLPGGGQFPERPPIGGAPYLTDYDSGLAAAIATLVAFYCRLMTGSGQFVDVSKQDCLVALQKQEIANYYTQGVVENRRTRNVRVGNMLPCKDGYFEIVAVLQHQWDGLMDLLGNPSWAQQEEYKDAASRNQRAAEVNAHIVAWAKDHTREEIYHGGQRRRVPVGAVRKPSEIVNSTQMQHRGFFKEADHPRVGRRKYPTHPYLLSETPVSLERGAPLLGEHNREVYMDKLGFSSEDLVRLREAGVI